MFAFVDSCIQIYEEEVYIIDTLFARYLSKVPFYQYNFLAFSKRFFFATGVLLLPMKKQATGSS